MNKTKKDIVKKNKTIKIILFTFFLILFIVSSLKIINYLKDNSNNRKIQNNTTKSIKKVKIDKDIKYDIDFKTLKKKNPDTIAYLKVNGTNIDYVVVKGNDNNYYLNHNFNKETNISGWIFSDYRNKFDGSDKNIIIYGHNTYDGSMFGTLRNILDNEWKSNKENLKITLVTEKDTYYYEVFSTYIIDPEEYYINTTFNTDNEFNKFIKTIKARSNYDYNIDLNVSDTILTLSSCSSLDGSKRIVLHAKLIK